MPMPTQPPIHRSSPPSASAHTHSPVKTAASGWLPQGVSHHCWAHGGSKIITAAMPTATRWPPTAPAACTHTHHVRAPVNAATARSAPIPSPMKLASKA